MFIHNQSATKWNIHTYNVCRLLRGHPVHALDCMRMCRCVARAREFPHYAEHNARAPHRHGLWFMERSFENTQPNIYTHTLYALACECACVYTRCSRAHTDIHNLWLLLPTKQMTPLYNLCKERIQRPQSKRERERDPQQQSRVDSATCSHLLRGQVIPVPIVYIWHNRRCWDVRV